MCLGYMTVSKVVYAAAHTPNRMLKGQESLKKSPRRRCDLSGTADDMIVLWRARIKHVFGSAWSVHVVKCSELKYFLRGSPPPKATPGVVLIDASPAPNLDRSTIRRKHPGDVQKQEIRPRRLHKTPSLKAMLN